MEVSPNQLRPFRDDGTFLSGPSPPPTPENQLMPQSLSVAWGYDSDVAREKAIDYTTKIYAVSIREMEGTKPHQQLKEVSMEERYGIGKVCLHLLYLTTNLFEPENISLPLNLYQSETLIICLEF